MIIRKKKTIIILFTLLCFFIPLFSSSKSFAAVDKNAMLKKWVFTIHRQCLQAGSINTPLSPSSSAYVAQDVMKKGKDYGYPSYQYGRESASVNIKTVNCYDNFLTKPNGLNSVLDYANVNWKTIKWDGDPESLLVNKLLYGSSTSGGGQFFNLMIPFKNDSTSSTANFKITKSGNSFSVSGNSSYLKVKKSGNNLVISLPKTVGTCKRDDSKYQGARTIPFGSNFETFRTSIPSKIGNVKWVMNCTKQVGRRNKSYTMTFNLGSTSTSGIISNNSKYTYSSSKNAEQIKSLSGYTINELNLTDGEVYTLYKWYIERARAKVSGSSLKCGDEIKGKSKTSADTEVNSLKNGKIEKCYLNLNGKKPSSIKVYVQIQNSTRPHIEQKTLAYAIEELNKLDAEQLKKEGVTPLNVSDNKTDSDEGEPTCMNSGGAGSLGWILCPLLDVMSDAAEGVYNEYVEPALQVDPKIFNTNDSTRQAWSTFRDIANVIFVILLLVVIFSQLTGVGIDNYGIKKILPKLIIAAILINLSYWICIILIDVSNIVGNGFQAMFNGLAEPLNPTVGFDGLKDTSGSQLTGNLISVGIIGAIVAAGATIWANPAIVISLLVSALGIMVSIFFLFIILAAREAAIIVLTVVSPIAVVLYMLPNTKSIFDKWVNMFKGLLLVYPICGLLVGGGNYISTLLMDNSAWGGQSFFNAFMAMIIGIAPIFFIPTVLKSSFAAIGTVGQKIAGFGSGARGKFEKTVRGSDRYKSIEEDSLRRRSRYRAGLNKEGQPTAIGRLGAILPGGRSFMNKQRGQYLSGISSKQQEARLGDEISMEAARVAQIKSDEATKVGEYMTLLNHETKNGADEDTLNKRFDEYMKNGDVFGAIAAARIAGRRKDTASRFMENTLMNHSKQYDTESLSKVAKEMAEGENAKNFRAASPLGFEYASNLNTGTAFSNRKDPSDPSGKKLLPATDYADWIGNQENVDNATQHHITNGNELVGTQKSNLKEIAKLMESGHMSDDEAGRLRTLAQETINNRGQTGVWDSTKEAEIYRIAGMQPGVAQEGEVLNLRNASDGAVGEMATDPNIPSQIQNAAQKEWDRRNLDNKKF